MAQGFPLPAGTVIPDATPPNPKAAAARTAFDSLHYLPAHATRRHLAAAAMLSASLHVALLFGVRRAAPAPPPVRSGAPPDLALPVPTQADVPGVPRPDDFVQALDFSSLLEKPDLRDARISVIPENIRRGLELRSRIGAIFNLAELDRHPEPVVQVAPTFPFNLKRDSIEGRVIVDFVVDTEGRVLGATAVESSHPGFEEAAVTGVTRWKFRPGQRNGRPVNTRMRVPILFRLTDGES